MFALSSFSGKRKMRERRVEEGEELWEEVSKGCSWRRRREV